MARTNAERALALLPLVAGGALWTAWIALFVLRVVRTPPQLSNEAELMYEASRVARGLALYTDPLTGALDDGPLPIRHFVLYGPLAPSVLALVAEPHRLMAARAVSVAVWFVGLPALAFTGRTGARHAAVVVALSYVGLFLLGRNVVYFTLTPVPAVLAAVALLRVVRKGKLDFGASLLFTLAWVIKPVVMGIALGVALFTVLDRRTPRADRAASLGLGAMILATAIALLLLTTGGAWVTHMRASTANGMLPLLWAHYTYDYFVLLGLPHLAVALWLLAQRGRGSSAVTGWALLGSTLWAIFAMGKRGANVGYFLEPTAALVVALAHFPDRETAAPSADGTRAAWRLLPRVALLAAPFVSAAIALPQLRSFVAMDADAEWALFRAIRLACEKASPGGQIRAGLPQHELSLSGRITLAPWQHVVLVNHGAFPLEILVKDLDVPELGCIVHGRGLEGPPPVELTPTGELTYFDVLFDVKLRQPIRDRFEEFAVIGELHLFRRRRPAPEAP